GQRGMMLDPLPAFVPRQQMIKVPAPARWIRPSTKSECGCRVQNLLDAPAQPNSCFPFLVPDRLEHPQDLPDVYPLHLQCQERLTVSLDRVLPLLLVLGVLPFVSVLGDVFLRDLVEGFVL